MLGSRHIPLALLFYAERCWQELMALASGKIRWGNLLLEVMMTDGQAHFSPVVLPSK